MTIVCGTDLSEGSNQALTAAFALAQRRGDREIVVLNVLDPDAEGDRARDSGVARTELEAAIAHARIGTIEARVELAVGAPVESLVAATETEGGDLLVVASQGHSHARAFSLGGTSGGAAAAARVPVLVVRDAAPFVAWAAGTRPLRVMLGLDESASADPAVGLLHALRKLGPVDVVIGHVYYVDEAARRYGVKTRSMVDADPVIEQLLRRDLERRLGELPGVGTAEFRCRPGLGRIGDHLLEIADQAKVDLVIVGTRHKGALGRLSSVSSVLLHDAKQSVWCVPAHGYHATSTVPRFRVAVVATDLSNFGNQAVPYAYTLVSGPGAEVHLVHVRDEDHEGGNPADLAQRLLALVPPGQAAITSRPHVLTGDDPARTIGEAAERLGADVVVLVSRARSGLTRALLGSVADKLLRSCTRPVLILRPPTE